MTEPIYNEQTALSGRGMSDVFGSFWTELYQSADLIAAYAVAMGYLLAERQDMAQQAMNTLSCADISPLREQQWVQLVIRESDLSPAPREYGDGLVYGLGSDGQIEVYGGTLESHGARLLPVSDDWVDVGLLTDSPTTPTSTWVRGVHYEVQDGQLRLHLDPFDVFSDAVETRYDDSGQAAGRVLSLWSARVKTDAEDVQKNFGPLTGLSGRSSGYMAAAALSVLRLLSTGPSEGFVRRALAAVVGIPVCLTPGEQVTDIQVLENGATVATDQNTYHLPSTTSPAVGVGQTLRYGDSLATAIRFYRGRKIRSLPGKAFWFGRTALAAPNESTPVTAYDSGNRVRIGLQGPKTTVAAFWDAAQDAGLDLAAVLSEDGSLPAATNPFELLSDEELSGVLVVRIRAKEVAADAPGLQNLAAIQQHLPAGYRVRLLVDLPGQEDAMDVAEGSESLAWELQ